MQHEEREALMPRLPGTPIACRARHVFSLRPIVLLASSVLAVLIVIGPARAEDEPGTKDPPAVGRYAGSRIGYQSV